MGVRGINLADRDEVIGMQLASQGTDLLIVSEKGMGKRTSVDEFTAQNRGGKGVKCYKITEKTGNVVGIKGVHEDDEIMIISEEGVVVRTPVSGISELGRSTQGVRVMNVADKDRVTAVAIASSGKKKRAKAADGVNDNQMALLEEESKEGTLSEDDIDE